MSEPQPPQPEERPAAPDPADPDWEEAGAQNDEVIARAFRRSLLVLVVAAVVVAAAFGLPRLLERPPAERAIAVDAPHQVSAEAVPPLVPFTDVTAASGLDFVHESGATGERFLPETMGGGAAFFDYDEDGDQDLLLSSGTSWPGEPVSAATTRLYENDGAGRFTDRTRESGLGVRHYGTGIAIGDVDNDGYRDVFLAALGPNRLWRNVPGAGNRRRFEEVSETSGVKGDPAMWSTSAAFFDLEGDGDLDLFVGNYVRWSREIDREVNFTLDGTHRAYGPPVNYQGTFPYLYRNDGGLRFTDISKSSGVEVVNPATGLPVAKTLGVAAVDVDGDRLLDLLVANDTVRKFFFHNRGGGRFEETGEPYGLAYGPDGAATGAMGCDAAWFRNDDQLAFVVGNFANEMTSFYVSQGSPLLYADQAIAEGIGAPSRQALSFGVFFADYDLDGRLDLLQVNGHLESEIGRVDPSQEYRQPAQLFWNAGARAPRTFVLVPAERTGALAGRIVGRGSAYADIDGDLDLDFLLLQTGGPAVLVRNDQALAQHALRLDLRGDGKRTNRDAIGAVVEVEVSGLRQRRLVVGARGYQSQSELPVTFGLGAAGAASAVRIAWPDGAIDDLGPLVAGQYRRKQGEKGPPRQ